MATKVKNSLVEEIKKAQELTSTELVEQFLSEEVIKFKDKIEDCKDNIEDFTKQLEKTLKQLSREKRDATLKIKKAYLAIDIKEIELSSDADNFANNYWNNISDAESHRQILDLREKVLKEQNERLIKHEKDLIKKFEERIEKIS